MLTPARFAASHERSRKEIPKAAKAFMEALQNVSFLDPTPQNMRGYSFLADKSRLKSDGGNVSSVLFDLCQARGLKSRVLDFIRDLPEQNIADIRFLEGPRKDVVVQLVESFGGRERGIDAALASDGTLRVLAVAAALLSAPRGSTVVIEAIDNGVHPSRAKALLASIETAAKENLLAVLLTSHNPVLLDSLPVAALGDVVFCHRDPREGDSQLLCLKDLPRYPEWIAQGPLGRLMTQGVPDGFSKDTRTKAQRVRDGIGWIERLKSESSS